MSRLIIWDEETRDLMKGFEQEGDDVVYSEDKLIEELKNRPAYDAIIILVELDWRGHYLQEFYGITIAQEIRKKENLSSIQTVPILFVSSLKPKQIHELEEHRKIIGACGHGFIELNAFSNKVVEEELDKIKSLNKIQYSDIRKHHCDIRGSASDFFHELKNDVGEMLDNGAKPIQIIQFMNKGLDELKKLLAGFGDAIEYIDNEMKIKLSEKKEKYICTYFSKSASLFLERFRKNDETELLKYIQQQEIDKVIRTGTDKSWEILWLEDQTVNPDIIAKLKDRGIKCHVVSSYLKAEKIIKKDKWNKITVGIADIRLYVNKKVVNEIKECFGEKADEYKRYFGYLQEYGKSLKEQEQQGYDFLMWVAQQDRFNKLVAFSGLSRAFLRDFSRKYHYDIKVYAKNNILAGTGMDIFVNDIEEYGDEIEETIYSLPNSSGWENNYKIKYKEHRNTKGYKTREENISKKAIYWIKNYQEGHKIEHLMEDLGERTISRNFENFNTACVARRVALWLHRKGKNSDEIKKLIKGDKGDIKQVISQELGLRLTDFPTNMSIEEKKWFQNEMDYPIFKDDLSIIRSCLDKISSAYGDLYISKQIDLKDTIINEGNILSFQYGISEFSIKFDKIDKKLIPVIRDFTTCRALTYYFSKKLDTEDIEQLKNFRSCMSEIKNYIKDIEQSENFRSCMSEIKNHISRLRKIYENLYYYVNKIIDKKLGKIFIVQQPGQRKENEELEVIKDKVFYYILTGNEPSSNEMKDELFWKLMSAAYIVKIEFEEEGKEISENNKKEFINKVIEKHNKDEQKPFPEISIDLSNYIISSLGKGDDEDDE